MSGHHHHGSHETEDLTPAQQAQRKTALAWLIGALIPLALATVIGLFVLWPTNVSEHVNTAGIEGAVPGATTVTGTIKGTEEVSCQDQTGTAPGTGDQLCVAISVTVDEGPEQGSTQQFTLTNAHLRSGVSVGDRVSLYRIPLEGGDPPLTYAFRDFERTTPLWIFGIVFAVAVVAVARLRGFLSLLGLGFAFFILARFMMPALIEGKDPLLVGVVGSAAIMFVVLYLAHGFTLRTTTALVGTLFGLLLTAVLGLVGVHWAHLTGIGGEDDFVLSTSAPDLKLTSVVVCAVIVAAMGALNDVTITQASAVWELADTVRDRRRLYRSAMRIGRDHIASTVYTIAFAAAGAALPVLLLLTILERPFGEVITSELFAGEILRTTIGSIGLVLAVPVTTAVGVLAVSLGRSATGGEPALAGVPGDPDNPGDPAAASENSAPTPTALTEADDHLEPIREGRPSTPSSDDVYRRPE